MSGLIMSCGTAAANHRLMSQIPIQMSFIRARALSNTTLAVVGLALAACGPMHDAATTSGTPDSTRIRPDSANGTVASAADSHAKQFAGAPKPAPTPPPATRADSTAKKPSTRKDTSIAIKLLKGRTAKDSFSLLVAIRSGVRMMDKWPSHDA